jgi:hypothetical protein
MKPEYHARKNRTRHAYNYIYRHTGGRKRKTCRTYLMREWLKLEAAILRVAAPKAQGNLLRFQRSVQLRLDDAMSKETGSAGETR